MICIHAIGHAIITLHFKTFLNKTTWKQFKNNR